MPWPKRQGRQQSLVDRPGLARWCAQGAGRRGRPHSSSPSLPVAAIHSPAYGLRLLALAHPRQESKRVLRLSAWGTAAHR